MTYKRILLFALFSVVCLLASADVLKINSLKCNTMDLTASTNARLDFNNVPCAVVKVTLHSPGVAFEGNVVGEPVFRTNEYWVYLTDGTKFLNIKYPSAKSLMVKFADYGFESVKSKNTYVLDIDVLREKAGGQSFRDVAFNVNPPEAVLVVNNRLVSTTDGRAVISVSADGENTFLLSAKGYKSVAGVIGADSVIEVKLTEPRDIDAVNSIETEANQDYKKKNYAQALEKYIDICSDSRAMGRIHSMYKNGDGVEPDPAEGFRWVKLAAENGDSFWQYQLAWYFEKGEGTAVDSLQAFGWYEKSANAGYWSAAVTLGDKYFDGIGVHKDYKKALQWYYKAGKDPRALLRRGMIYYHGGAGVETDYESALDCFLKNEVDYTGKSQFYVAYMYENGLGVKKDLKEAAKWYRNSLENKNMDAAVNLALLYLQGKGVSKDYDEALRLLKKAAHENNAVAYAWLGKCYLEGKGVKKNKSFAKNWFDKAVDGGVDWAAEYLEKLK